MKKVLIKLIDFYTGFISPHLGTNCRFYPVCSCYAKQAIQKYGVLSGSAKAFWRIARCGPWSKGGVEMP